MSDYDFSGLTDLDLVALQKELRGTGDDEFLDAVLKELGKRHKIIGVGRRSPIMSLGDPWNIKIKLGNRDE